MSSSWSSSLLYTEYYWSRALLGNIQNWFNASDILQLRVSLLLIVRCLSLVWNTSAKPLTVHGVFWSGFDLIECNVWTCLSFEILIKVQFKLCKIWVVIHSKLTFTRVLLHWNMLVWWYKSTTLTIHHPVELFIITKHTLPYFIQFLATKQE